MLSDEERREILDDAKSNARRRSFAQVRISTQDQPMTWEQYFRFLRSIQNLFPQERVPKKTEGNMFKL